jgi:plastocyanin
VTKNGQAVSQLPAGAYVIKVHDPANFHNFHLKGPGGVDRKTPVEQDGTIDETWDVTFVTGNYHYQCDPHAQFMFGDFTVT